MWRRKKTLIVLGIFGFILCRSGTKAKTDPQAATAAADSAQADTAAINREEIAAVVREDSMRITIDSVPFETRTALRFDARVFVMYRPDEYDSALVARYHRSGSNGVYVVRANLQGLGDDYVFAGRSRGTRSVMAVMRRTFNGGWVVRNVTSGDVGTRAPIDSASVWITRARHGHPNGQWDAVVVRRIYATEGDAETVYYWDAERQLFVNRGAAPLIIR